jgi:hypothetical protein
MKRLLVLTLLFCLPAMAQDLKQYAGTWETSFQGKPFFTLNLVANGEKLTGTVVHDNFNLDQQGNISEIEPRDAHERVTIVRPVAKGIDIYVHDDSDPTETGHYHLELTSDHEGKLSLVLLEPGSPAIKPRTLKKKP